MAQLSAIGDEIRAHRKRLGVSATTAAQAAGLSRVTLHRIERGEPSVTIGAVLNVLAALNLGLEVRAPPGAAASPAPPPDTKDWIPARVLLADYPQLQRLAWQVNGTKALTPAEALGVYERNWRHLDLNAMAPNERNLVDALRTALGDGAAARAGV